jgi:thioredoxin 1
MNKKHLLTLFAAILAVILLAVVSLPVCSAEVANVPVKGMVTLVDLGARSCIPCKMMAPILERLEKRYAGRAAVIFLDVWKDPKPANYFGIRAIPTQIFFDKDGKEVYRHMGFMSEEDIVKQLNVMGVR